MGTFALTDAKIIMGPYDLSSYHNSLTVSYGAEMLDNTRFGTSGTRSFQPGLKTVGLEANGFWDPATDAPIFARIQAIREVFSFAAQGSVEGGPAYTVHMVNGQYNPGGEVGQLLQYSFTGQSANSPLVRGRFGALGVKSAAGNSAETQFVGGVPAGYKLYASLHVLAVGTSVDVTIESAAASGFASPTVRITFPQQTAIGAVEMSVDGPITDEFWRATWTPTGGDANIFVVFGIR